MQQHLDSSTHMFVVGKAALHSSSICFMAHCQGWLSGMACASSRDKPACCWEQGRQYGPKGLDKWVLQQLAPDACRLASEQALLGLWCSCRPFQLEVHTCRSQHHPAPMKGRTEYAQALVAAWPQGGCARLTTMRPQ